MNRVSVLAVLCAALTLPAAAQTSGDASPWVHVRVQETGRDAKVAVNLPLSVVHAVLEAAPDKVVTNGHLRIGDHRDMRIADLRRAWQELAKAGDADIITVEEPGEKVSVRRAGGKLLVHVDKPDAKEQVRVEIPAQVVDAFFSAPGDEVNVKAALTALAGIRGELVKVDDEDSSVRIWIDERP